MKRPLRTSVALFLVGLVTMGLLVLSSSVTFAQDVTPPSAVFSPSNSSNVFTTNPFIVATYDEEVTIIEALFGKVGDTPVDVTGQLVTGSQKLWAYAAVGLQIDTQYTFTIRVLDVAGNPSGPESTTFTVSEPAFQIPLYPGWNLISFPAEPVDPAINSVFQLANDDVNKVITTAKTQGLAGFAAGCNPLGTLGPECLSAERVGEGPLTGNLVTIAAGQGDWVQSTSFDPIDVEIPPESFASLPPSIPIFSDWDLLGVVTLNASTVAGDLISADVYFAGTGWTVAYTFDTQVNAWTQLLPLNFYNVEVGNGYYLGIPNDTDLITGAPTPTPTPIPGLTWWGMLLLAGVFGALLVRRAMTMRGAAGRGNT